jgi:type I restriction-modification system DNA methylase subunit
MNSNQFKLFLSQIGYSKLIPKDEKLNSFSYEIQTPSDFCSQKELSIQYFYLQDKNNLFEKHLTLWNQNNLSSFIAVFNDKTYIIDARQKPEKDSPTSKRVVIKTFDYGVNTKEYSDIKEKLNLISKEGIDNSFYFNFVIAQQRKRKAYEVDKDLLLNLLALRKDLYKRNQQIADLLILRCLFVKYLEDRGVFESDTLLNALYSESPTTLIRTFAKVRKINGDLFTRNELRTEDIQTIHLNKLADFFGYYDYRTKQVKFFPYQFDKIPIQLISHIYESFLKEETKKGSGIYYTPSFLVNFMLSQTLQPKLDENPETTMLDPACGSGSFLVSAFRMMIIANNAENNYDKKKEILQKQLFGVDLDPRALQIAAFSLYLALLEGEKKEFIQEKIRNEFPILPGLIDKTLLCANALTDDVTFTSIDKSLVESFDCIASNPPWGSVPDDNDEENIKTRLAIGFKSKKGSMEIFQNVSDYQRSQAFLLYTAKWSHKETITAMVVNNSIFFNENAEGFRKDLLNNFYLYKFYELSDINPILFKKHSIGKIKNETVVVGANEPSCVVIYGLKEEEQYIKYISPKLNPFSENLRLLAYRSKDVVEVAQKDLLHEDLLWRIFAIGNWSEYQIIKKRILEKDLNLNIKCDVGFQPKESMRSLGTPKFRTIIEPSDFVRFNIINNNLRKFDWNRALHRKRKDETIYTDPRILIPVRPLESDELRFRGIYVNKDLVFKDNIECIRIYKNGKLIENYKPYLAIINSKFMGFLSYYLSSQWGKGNKRVRLNTTIIENLPLPTFNFSDTKIKKLIKLVDDIEKGSNDVEKIENEIDKIVYDLYNLSEYERSVVNEFYEIFYCRENDLVKDSDLESYSKKFSSTFSLMLSDNSSIFYNYKKSKNVGAVVRFKITEDKNNNGKESDLSVLNIVKRYQTERSYISDVLTEEKVKYYDKEKQQFYIIKSNWYKDWTERQAIDDANEEIRDIINFIREK